MDNVSLSLITALGMIIVALIPLFYWRRLTNLKFRWFCLGAGLWFVSVELKSIFASLYDETIIGFLSANLPELLSGAAGGLYIGIRSSFFEIGLTLLAVLIWKQLGRNSERAIGIGIGAGSFEALLLGLGVLFGAVVYFAGLPGAEEVRVALDSPAELTTLFFLIGPAERSLTIPVHVASRALIILGVAKKKALMVFLGFLIFTLLDGVAGAAHVFGLVGEISLWWIQLAVLPFALLSIPLIIWCYKKWRENGACGHETRICDE